MNRCLDLNVNLKILLNLNQHIKNIHHLNNDLNDLIIIIIPTIMLAWLPIFFENFESRSLPTGTL